MPWDVERLRMSELDQFIAAFEAGGDAPTGVQAAFEELKARAAGAAPTGGAA